MDELAELRCRVWGMTYRKRQPRRDEGQPHPSRWLCSPDMSARARRGPIRIGLVDDYEVVLIGVAHLFDRYQDRVMVVEIDLTEGIRETVDIALYDNFAQGEADQADIEALIQSPHADRVVVYTWNFDERLVRAALRKGAHG